MITTRPEEPTVMSQEQQTTLMKALDYAYEKSINGLPGFDSARRMAETYQRSAGTPRDQANALIRWQVAKAGTSGFLAGVGGVLSMPVLLPANIATVMVVQVRMIAAIACLGGHDVSDDRVKSLVYVCLAGNSAKDVLKDVGVVVGTRLTRQMIQGLSGKTLTAINQKVGFRLLTKFGQTGAINLGKAIPLAGGVIGATFDATATHTVGRVARDTFLVDADATWRPGPA